MEKNKFSSGVITVLIANIINLGFSILTSFLLPKFLSVETYATIKNFSALRWLRWTSPSWLCGWNVY